MVLQEFPPSPILAEFVRVYRIVKFVFHSSEQIPFKPYAPKPEHCLSFYPRDTETVQYDNSKSSISNIKVALIGQHNVVSNRYVGKDFVVFQVVFRPSALFRLTGIPVSELNNSYIDAENVFHRDIRFINEQLGDTQHTYQMIDIVESFLKILANQSKKTAHRLDYLSSLLIHPQQAINVDWLASESCLSLRQFERKFIERVGIPPKYFHRIVRFENAYRMKNKYPHLDWLTIALQCGYYDYQHLVKDYKEFTKATPTHFHLLDLSAPERKFGEADTY
ncbi:helix-turn-helix domain-containing protein [Flectobacillus major]|uniref:helix-turn-helix domain-containing protein n=1 Tax=Flectobacillus major TaxID=103 RepID=UPI000414A5E5|nr:helix-turn-helix domain-containing protein [Flectobacillus major]